MCIDQTADAVAGILCVFGHNVGLALLWNRAVAVADDGVVLVDVPQHLGWGSCPSSTDSATSRGYTRVGNARVFLTDVAWRISLFKIIYFGW